MPSWIPAAVGAGASILGSVMQGKAANKGSERKWELLAEEMKRRNALQGILAPQTLHALGYRNPADIEQATNVIRVGPASGSPMGAPPPSSAPSTAGKVLGAAGTGLGIAGAAGGAGLLGSLAPATKVGLGITGTAAGAGGVPGALGLGGGAGMLGLGAATIPVLGGLIAGGAYAANKIGQGRRTANKMTQGGPQEQFEAEMGQARTAAELDAAYQKFMSSVNQWKAAGGNSAKVADQALNKTPVLWQTYETRRRELGGR